MKKLSGWLSVLLFVIFIAAYPLQLSLDAMYGVEGWEMAEVYPESVADAAQDREAFLAQFGASINEPISEQLSYIGRPGPFTENGQKVRFVFVPADRQIESAFGTLIVFDRSASQELLQSQSMQNISLLVMLAAAIGALASAALWFILRRRSPAP